MKNEKTNLLGRWGEERVADYLRQLDYQIVGAGWRCRFGEIDLIAQKGDYLAFVEVKLRKNDNPVKAREFVNDAKQRRLSLAALLYLQSNPTQLQPRFDVAEVYAPAGTETKCPKIEYFENAFLFRG